MEGAGGFSSTLADLQRWHQALNNHSLLSPASTRLLFTGHNKMLQQEQRHVGGGSHYGYGWVITEDENGHRHATHNGSNGYSFAEIHRFIEADVLVVIVTNDIDAYPKIRMKRLLQLVRRQSED